MKRTTTPTHVFNVDIDPSTFTALNITYAQYDSNFHGGDNQIILIKTLDDCIINGNTISVTLTQEETNLFQGLKLVYIQLHAIVGIKSYQSNIIKILCREVLNDEVLSEKIK